MHYMLVVYVMCITQTDGVGYVYKELERIETRKTVLNGYSLEHHTYLLDT